MTQLEHEKGVFGAQVGVLWGLSTRMAVLVLKGRGREGGR